MSKALLTIFLVSAALLVFPAAGAAQGAVAESESQGGVMVTFLANEGFLLAAGETKVLIDGLFGSGIRGYPAVPEALRERAETAAGEFAAVDVVLASHVHGDHFDPRAVLRHLQHNEEARFVSTSQAVDRLLALDGAAAVKERVVSLTPSEGAELSFEHGGVKITALNFHHGRGLDPPIANLGSIIELDGKRFVHLGDTEAVLTDVEAYDLPARRVDVVLLPYWHLLDARFQSLINAWGADQIVAMHLPSATAPAGYFSPAEDLESLVRTVDEGADWVPVEPASERRF